MPSVVTPLKRQRELFLPPGRVPQLLGMSKSAFYRLLATDDSFPRPVVLPGQRTPAYRVADVIRWAKTLK